PTLGAVSYLSLPTGHVGQPYSGTIKIAGGTPPYTFSVYSLLPFGAMPAGLTLSPTGVVSGTPQAIGNYLIPAIVSDSAGHSAFFSARVIVTQAGVASPLLAGTSKDTVSGTVGAPYLFLADLSLVGGEAPYTWSVHAG